MAIAIYLVAAALNEGPTFAADLDAGPKPNIVLMMADDLGWGDVGFNGNKVIRTRHLDAMASAGLKFNRFYSAAPVCSPTRGSCVTGRHPYRYGIFSANVGHMPSDELTLAELLKRLGYTTGHFGKWHLGTLSTSEKDSNRGGSPNGAKHYSPPWKNGFDICFSTEAKVPTWDPMLKSKGAKRNKWWDPVVDAAEAVPYGTAYWSNGQRIAADKLRGDDSRIIMDQALSFIVGSAQKNKPFFAVIWFHAPHLPVVAGPKYTAMYQQYDKHSQHYFGCITALDEQVGRLRQELRRLGVAKNTMVWFCSDNGPEGNDTAPGSTGGLRGRKRSLFEGGVRVPGILEWPKGIPTARVTDIPACTSDCLPTILDVLADQVGSKDRGLPPIDGESLLPLIQGRMKQRRKPIAFESAGKLALVDNQYKLIHVPEQRRRNGKRGQQQNPEVSAFMLFDLVADPNEKNDVAADHPEIVERMAADLKEWRKSCRRSLEGKDYAEAF